MAEGPLEQYIRAQLARGFSMQDVERVLINQGYTSEQVRQAISTVYNARRVEHETHPKGVLITAVVLILLCIGTAGFFLFGEHLADEEALIDFQIQATQTSFSEGEIVRFDRMASNVGQKPSFEVKAYYEIKDEQGKIVYNDEETFLLAGDLDKEIAFKLPRSTPGTYSIQARVNYDGKSETTTTSFTIEGDYENQDETQPSVAFARPTCNDGKVNQGEEGIDCGGPCEACARECPLSIDDGNSCTKDTCGPETNYLPVYEDIVPCCGNDVCEQGEQDSCGLDCTAPRTYFESSVTLDEVGNDVPLTERIDSIADLAKDEPNEAGKLCDSIRLPFYRDSCFDRVATNTVEHAFCDEIEDESTRDKCLSRTSKLLKDKEICGKIASDLRRDSCYMRFALQGDFSVCEKIVESYYVRSCNDLKEVSTASPELLAQLAQFDI